MIAESGGQLLFGAATAAYAGSLANYVALLGKPREMVSKLATALRLLALAFHTIFLAHRYVIAGFAEIGAREARGEVLAGSERFWTFVMHPPYTNLYESLMFVTWIIMVAYAIIEWRWKLKPLGVVAVSLTLAGLAEAYIVVEKDVKPLVPALQSKWILIHVGMIFVAYSLFLLAAIIGLFYLLKANVKTSLMGAVFMPIVAAVTLLAGGAKALLTRAAFEVTPLGMHNERVSMLSGEMKKVWSAVHYLPPGAEKPLRLWVSVPWVGPIVLLAVATLLGAAFLWWKEHKSGEDLNTKGPAFKATLAGFGLLTVGLGILVAKLASSQPFSPDMPGVQFVNDLPFRLSVGSNYSLGLLATTWSAVALFLGLALKRGDIVLRLPDAKKLDEMAYKVVIIGFPLLSIGIVLGGMWAAAAWGRFWGWDPKETWALITWAVYAIYLHVRITYGPGRKSAALAVFGFGVVIFTYMGVNLGLTGEGLHVYGQG